MPDSLLIRIDDFRRSIRRVIAVCGAGRLLALLVGLVVAVGWLDWLLHIDDPGLRLVLLLGITACAIAGAWYWLWSPLRQSMTDCNLAREIERQYPELQDGLSSTVQFVSDDFDTAAGDAQLQQYVSETTRRRVARLPFERIVNRRAMQGPIAMASIAVALLLFAFLFRPHESRLAASRLFLPFGNNPWPQLVDLQFVDETGAPLSNADRRIAQGDRLELFVRNERGALPADARVQVRFDVDRPAADRPLKTSLLVTGDGQSVEAGALSFTALSGPIWFRAIGGDDEGTAWLQFDVIPPPEIESLQVTVSPPAYAPQNEEQNPSSGHVSGLVGSAVAIDVQLTKPVSAAAFHLGSREAVPLTPTSDGRAVSVNFDLDAPGVSSWWLTLSGDQLEGRDTERYEVRTIDDRIPDVYIEEPASDLQVTLDADVPVRVIAKDDLGLADILLRYRIGLSEDGELAAIPLKSGPERPVQYTAEHMWSLRDLPLEHGSRIVFHAEAFDDFANTDDIAEPHIGLSVTRALIVVAPETKNLELAARQSGLLEQLERATALQTATLDQTGELRLQLENAGQLRDKDRDLLKRVELDQQRVGGRLTEPDDGVESQTQRILDELRNNHIDDAATERRLGTLAERLGALSEERLPTIENDLTTARKEAENATSKTASESTSSASTSASDEMQEALARAHDGQQQVADRLNDLLDELNQWKQQHDLVGELDRAIDRQQELRNDTNRIASETLGLSPSQQTAQQNADRARVADRQRRGARDLRETAEALDRTADEMEGSGQTLEQSIEDALGTLEQQATAGRMEDAARQIDTGRLGEADELQRQVLEDLNQLREMLTNQSIDDTETMVKRLEDAAEELRKQRDEQAEVLRKLDEENTDADSLRKVADEQQQLRDNLEQTARQLRRQWARGGAEAAQSAEQAMEDTLEHLRKEEPEDAADDARDALNELNEALQDTLEQRDQLAEQLAREAILKLADKVQGLAERQQYVVDESTRLRLEVEARGRPSRSQSRTIVNLADTQSTLADETIDAGKSVEQAKVIAFTLQSTAATMTQVADSLGDRTVGEQTVQAAERAHRKLLEIVKVLKEDQEQEQQPPTEQSGEPQDQDEGQQSGPQGESVSLAAQLMLLRSLQADIVDRTQKMDSTREDELTEAHQRELDNLADAQQQIARLAEELLAEQTQASQAEEEAIP